MCGDVWQTSYGCLVNDYKIQHCRYDPSTALINEMPVPDSCVRLTIFSIRMIWSRFTLILLQSDQKTMKKVMILFGIRFLSSHELLVGNSAIVLHRKWLCELSSLSLTFATQGQSGLRFWYSLSLPRILHLNGEQTLDLTSGQ